VRGNPIWLYHIATVAIFDARFDAMNREDRLHRRRIELEKPRKLQKKEI